MVFVDISMPTSQWNVGVMEYWNNGPGIPDNRTRSGGFIIRFKLYPLKTQYSINPIFHYSMHEVKIQALEKIPLLFES